MQDYTHTHTLTKTNVLDDLLDERNHAGHVIKDGDVFSVDLLKGKRVIVLHLLSDSQLRVGGGGRGWGVKCSAIAMVTIV